MQVSRRPIPQGVQPRHNYRQEYSKFVLYIERSLSYWNVLFVNFYAICYGDTVEQTTCTFSRSIPANGQLASSSMYREAVVISLARIKRENVQVVCSTVSL